MHAHWCIIPRNSSVLMRPASVTLSSLATRRLLRAPTAAARARAELAAATGGLEHGAAGKVLVAHLKISACCTIYQQQSS